MNATALGLTWPEGREPPLCGSTASPPCMRAKASAIWLRLLFSMQTKRTRLVIHRLQKLMQASAVGWHALSTMRRACKQSAARTPFEDSGRATQLEIQAVTRH